MTLVNGSTANGNSDKKAKISNQANKKGSSPLAS